MTQSGGVGDFLGAIMCLISFSTVFQNQILEFSCDIKISLSKQGPCLAMGIFVKVGCWASW